MIALAPAPLAHAVSSNLITTNPGFETGDFTGWSANANWWVIPDGANHYALCQSTSAISPTLGYGDVVGDIGGFGAHYYPPNGTPQDPGNYSLLDPHWVTDFAADAKAWLNSRALGARELWLIEVATWIWNKDNYLHCAAGEATLGAQVDGLHCLSDEGDYNYNVRNYVGALQDALGNQGFVDRWAWFADRYGDVNMCNSPDGHDGEQTALNEVCSGTTVLSPFGNNLSQAAPYR